jgi:hypothetical protein
VAYYGLSWVRSWAPLVPAVEPRIKVNVLALGGVDFDRSLPEVDQLPSAREATRPWCWTGTTISPSPVESTQEPFYHLLGSKKDQKQHLLYEGGHSVPRNELIRETLNWLDQYLGPVQ